MEEEEKWEETGHAEYKLSFLGCIGLRLTSSDSKHGINKTSIFSWAAPPSDCFLIPGDPQATDATVAANADLATHFPTAIMPQITSFYLFI
jgi:hypothetical protein